MTGRQEAEEERRERGGAEAINQPYVLDAKCACMCVCIGGVHRVSDVNKPLYSKEHFIFKKQVYTSSISLALQLQEKTVKSVPSSTGPTRPRGVRRCA